MTAKIETSKNGERFLCVSARKSTKLTMQQWTHLHQIAVELGLRSERGAKAGEPGWRTLLRRIADGQLKVSHA